MSGSDRYFALHERARACFLAAERAETEWARAFWNGTARKLRDEAARGDARDGDDKFGGLQCAR